MEWYYSNDGQQQGPVSVEILRLKISSGEVHAGDLAWCDGMSGWMPVSEIKEFVKDFPLGKTGVSNGVGSPTVSQDPSPYQTPQSQPLAPAPPGSYYGAPPLGSGKSTASMVLGICSLVFSCIPCLGLILGILAMVFGQQFVESSKSRPELAPYVGRATAGKVMGIIASVLGVLIMLNAVLSNVAN